MEPSGVYSVKSSYHHIQCLKGDWSVQLESDLWKHLWKLKVPPKVVHFAWRALRGCLPTRSQLQTRHVPVESQCVFCNNDVETILHVLILCPFAQSCWNRSAIDLIPSAAGSFPDWFAEFWTRQRTGAVEELLMVGWSIWKSRNELLWKNRSRSAAEVVSFAHSVLDQWISAQSCRTEPLLYQNDSVGSKDFWTKPEENLIKINVDGATFSAENAYGTGVIARNSDGKVLDAFASYFTGDHHASVAEIMSIKEALSWIKKKGWINVVVETDCLVAIQALNSTVDMPSMFGLLVQECKSLLLSLVNVKICHVKRSANKAAHCLARGSCFWSDRIFSESSIPSALQTIVIADLAI